MRTFKEFNLPRASKALLALLNKGLVITDDDKWKLVGGDDYIEPMTTDGEKFVSLGLWDNTINGLQSAIDDIFDSLCELFPNDPYELV